MSFLLCVIGNFICFMLGVLYCEGRDGYEC